MNALIDKLIRDVLLALFLALIVTGNFLEENWPMTPKQTARYVFGLVVFCVWYSGNVNG